MRVSWARITGTSVYTLPSLGPLYEEDRQQNFRDPGFLLFRARDSNSKAKTGRDSVLEVCARGEMAKATLGITELNSILVRITGLKNSTRDPLWKY